MSVWRFSDGTVSVGLVGWDAFLKGNVFYLSIPELAFGFDFRNV